MRIVCISDTHCRLRKVKLPPPLGDILVHTGDLTFSGNLEETEQELRELGRYRNDYKAILLVEGNHDWLGQRHPDLMGKLCKEHGVTLLRDSGATIEGLKFWGSPWQPEFCNWAWNLPRLGSELQEKWELIPADTEVLLTHGPPHGIRDDIRRLNVMKGEWEVEHVGCFELSIRVKQLKSLKLHVFGHIHCGYGVEVNGGVTYVNAAICNEDYKPVNKPIEVSVNRPPCIHNYKNVTPGELEGPMFKCFYCGEIKGD